MQLSALVHSVEDFLDAGDVDEAVARRKQLASACLNAREDPNVLRARVLAAELCLIMVERREVERLLKDYIKEGLHARMTEIERVASRDPLQGAALASAGGDFLFRQRAYDDAYKLTARAQELLAKAPLHDSRATVLRLWNLARWARISWRTADKGGFADHHLQRCLDYLARAGTEIRTGRAHSIEAFSLDVWASLDWARGRLDDARRKIYRALFLLQRGTVKDRARLGHALFTAGKIEASFSGGEHSRTAIDILEEAEKTFPDGHALKPQAVIQKAEALIKAGETNTAEGILGGLGRPDDPVQRTEAALAWAWIHIRSGEWAKGQERAQEILDQSRSVQIPRRLLAEGHLQLGRALVGSGDRKRGIGELKNALTTAVRHGRVKIEIAAHLELADTYILLGEDEDAHEHWQQATSLLSRVRSAYLEERRDEIGRRLRTGWAFVVETSNYELEKRKFSLAFFGRLVRETGGNVSAAADKAEVARSTAIRVMRNLPERTMAGAARTQSKRR